MTVPAGIWLGFFFLGALWFLLMPRRERWDPAGLLAVARYWSLFVTYILGVIAFILVGAVVLEDPAAGTTQFWVTRPMGHRRMFSAKVCSVGLIFVCAPTLLLLPIWLASGFSALELGRATIRLFGVQAAIAAVAFTVAATADDLRQFLGITAGCALIAAGFFWGTAWWTQFEDSWYSIWQARLHFVQLFCLIPLLGFVVTNQYLSRRRGRTIGVAVCALALAVGVGTGWHGSSAEPRAEPAGTVADIEIHNLAGPDGMGLFFGGVAGPHLNVSVKPVTAEALVVAPMIGTATVQWPGEPPTRVRLWSPAMPTPAIVRASALRERLPGQAEWPTRLGRLENRDLTVKPGTFLFEGQDSLRLLRPEWIGEIDVRPGATLVNGSDETCIVSIDVNSHTGVLDGIVVEERDAWTAPEPENWVLDDDPWGGRYNGYVLRLPKSNAVVVLVYQHLGFARFHSMQISYRTLTLPGRPEVVDLTGSSIVKVRFHEVRRVTQQIPKQRVPVQLEGKATK